MNDAEEQGASLLRSEERLRTTTRRVAVGRAVLRKTIVTEERTVTVRVRHEEAHLEVVPFDEPRPVEDDRGPSHLALPEFVLHREEVVVTTRLVPVERVRLHLQPVTEQQEVTEDVRSERVVLERTTADGSPTGA